MNDSTKSAEKKNETLDIEELNWTNEIADQTQDNACQSSHFENISMIKDQKDSPSRQVERDKALLMENDNILNELCAKLGREKRISTFRPSSGQFNKQKKNEDESSKESSLKNISNIKERTKSFSSARDLAIATNSIQNTNSKQKASATPKADMQSTCANHFFLKKDSETTRQNPSPTSQDMRQKSRETGGQERTTNFFMETRKKRMNDPKGKTENIMESNIEQLGGSYKSKLPSSHALKKPTIKMLYETSASGIGQRITDRSKEKTLSNKGSTTTSRQHSKEIRNEFGSTMTDSHRRVESRTDLSSKKISMQQPSYLDARNSPHLSAFKQKQATKHDEYSDYKGFSEIIKAKEDIIESLQRQLNLRTAQHEVSSPDSDTERVRFIARLRSF